MTSGLQLIGLVGCEVASASCIACGRTFQTEAVVPALCFEAEVVGPVCPDCLSPAERAGYQRRIAERSARR